MLPRRLEQTLCYGAAVSEPILLCTDGSDIAIAAVGAGLALLGPNRDVVVLTVVEPEDPSLVTGAGHQGGVMTPDEYEAVNQQRHADAHALVADTVARLGLTDVRTAVLEGSPGIAICGYAESERAAAIVVGTCGRRGLKRAILGSVSDHVVRNAPCPVVVTGDR